jgi:hypothetical protein
MIRVKTPPSMLCASQHSLGFQHALPLPACPVPPRMPCASQHAVCLPECPVPPRMPCFAQLLPLGPWEAFMWTNLCHTRHQLAGVGFNTPPF